MAEYLGSQTGCELLVFMCTSFKFPDSKGPPKRNQDDFHIIQWVFLKSVPGLKLQKASVVRVSGIYSSVVTVIHNCQCQWEEMKINCYQYLVLLKFMPVSLRQ